MGHPDRLSLVLSLVTAWSAGCASTFRQPEDLAGAVEQDLALPDLAQEAPPPDLKDPPLPPDLATPDLATPDLATPDLARPPDLSPPPDLATPDLARPPDLGPPPADMASPPPHLVAVLVGDGAAPLTTAAHRVSLHRYRLDGSEITGGGWPVALPAAASGAQHAFTLNGTSTAEGSLSRSADGRYLVLAGYGAAPGATGPNSGAISTSPAMTVHRVIARVSAAGAVDTSTAFHTAFDAANIRGAASVDGTVFWACGSSGGVQYLPFGGVAAGTQILANPGNTRVPHVIRRAAGDQLFATSGSAGFTTVFSIGAGTPTTGGQSAGVAPGLAQSNASPYGFALLDRDPNVAGPDTLYIADDKGVGIQKWTFNGASWALAATFTAGFTTGTRGLFAAVTGGAVTLVATTAEALPAPNTIAVLVDDGTMNPTARVIVTAPMNTQLRGVAPAP